jgi:hypothetical protein
MNNYTAKNDKEMRVRQEHKNRVTMKTCTTCNLYMGKGIKKTLTPNPSVYTKNKKTI